MGSGSSVEQGESSGSDGKGKEKGNGPTHFFRKLSNAFDTFLSRQLSVGNVTQEKIQFVISETHVLSR